MNEQLRQLLFWSRYHGECFSLSIGLREFIRAAADDEGDVARLTMIWSDPLLQLTLANVRNLIAEAAAAAAPNSPGASPAGFAILAGNQLVAALEALEREMHANSDAHSTAAASRAGDIGSRTAFVEFCTDRTALLSHRTMHSLAEELSKASA